MAEDNINVKKRKHKKLGPIRRRRRREKIQSILILLIQVVCISLLFAHSIKKYAPDTMQCTHSFNTTISDVKRAYVSHGRYVVFETCEGKVFINFDGGIGAHLAERIDATIKELRYLSDNNIEVSVMSLCFSLNSSSVRSFSFSSMAACPFLACS